MFSLLNMSTYYSLPRVRLNKKEDVKKLNNFSNAYSRLFYKERAKDLDFDIASIAAQKVTAQNEPLTDDVKNVLLATRTKKFNLTLTCMLHVGNIMRQVSGVN